MNTDGLDPTSPINVALAQKYNAPAMVIAYLRAALMRQDNKYDKESLIFHITEENLERKKEIQLIQRSITEENYEGKKEQILAIQKKMDFRQGILAVLRTIEDHELKDILQPA